MKNKKSISISTTETPLTKSNITNPDFQKKGEESADDLLQSGKSELEKRKERTHNGSTKPDKNHIW